MEINPISIAYIPGIIQGLILLAATNFKRSRPTPSRHILNLLLLSITLLLIHHGLILNGYRLELRFFMGLAAALWFSISPLLYLYIKSLLDPDFRFKPKYILLFTIPIYNVVQWALHLAGSRIGLYLLFDDFDTYVYAWIFNYLLVSTLFSLASLSDIRKAGLHKKHFARIRWLKWYLFAFLAILIGSVTILLFVITAQQYSDDFEFSLLIVYEVFVFVLVFKSVYSSNYIHHISNDSYRQASRKPKELSAEARKLLRCMEVEKPWLDKALGLAGLSQCCGIPENTLSQIFNQHLKTNFYEFVNSYRLQALEEMILDPANRQFKIASIAEECGFSSKTSFYKAFKQKHQMTPTEFLKQHS